MAFQNIGENDGSQLKELINAADFSGERFLVQSKDGSMAAIVPVEDLEVLERLEKPVVHNVLLS